MRRWRPSKPPFSLSFSYIFNYFSLGGHIHYRQTSATFPANWVFENSGKRALRGKTHAGRINLGIINLDALFVMKAVSARATDIRDVFMLAPYISDLGWVKKALAEKCQVGERLSLITRTIASKQFRDGLQWLYGRVDEKVFERHRKAIAKLAIDPISRRPAL